MSSRLPIALKFCGMIDLSDTKLWEKVSFENNACTRNGARSKFAVLVVSGQSW